jgi:hypothetical protein
LGGRVRRRRSTTDGAEDGTAGIVTAVLTSLVGTALPGPGSSTTGSSIVADGLKPVLTGVVHPCTDALAGAVEAAEAMSGCRIVATESVEESAAKLRRQSQRAPAPRSGQTDEPDKSIGLKA